MGRWVITSAIAVGAFGFAFVFLTPLIPGLCVEVDRLEVGTDEYVITQSTCGDMWYVELFAKQPDGRWDDYLLDNDDVFWFGHLASVEGKIDVFRYGGRAARFDPATKLLSLRYGGRVLPPMRSVPRPGLGCSHR